MIRRLENTPSRAAVRWGRGALLPLALLLTQACGAAQWTMRAAQPPLALQWPYQPARAKLTYVESLSGFAQKKGSAAAWHAVVYGKGQENPNSFVLPVGVAVGGDGRVAVADLGRRCVHLFLPEKQAYLRLAGSKTDTMVSPVGVVFDDASNLFVSDSAGKLFAFSAEGHPLFTLEKAGEEPLQRPTGIAYSPRSKLLFLVDTLASRIHALHSNGEAAYSFGKRGEEAGSFNFPTHIAWSAPGELYLTDSLNFRIEILDERGNPLGSFGHHGDGSGDVAMPKGVAVDSDGIVYLVDAVFDNVQLFDRKGDFLLTLGGRGVDFGEFWLPSGAFISKSGDLYVCDTYNHRVQIFRITPGYVADAS